MRFPLISILILATSLPMLAHEHGRREEWRGHAVRMEEGPRFREEHRPLARSWAYERREDRRDEYRDEYRRDNFWRNRDEVVLRPGSVFIAPPVPIPFPLPLPRVHVRFGF